MTFNNQVAGRELDAIISHYVMGIAPCESWSYMNFGSAGGPALIKGDCEHGENGCYPLVLGRGAKLSGPPNYSTEVGVAWEVIEHMQGRGIDIGVMPWNNKWVAGFNRPLSIDWWSVARYDIHGELTPPEYIGWALCQTPALAICSVALIAVQSINGGSR